MWYIDQIERFAKLRHSLVRSRRASVCVQLCLALRALWECLGGGQEPLQEPLTLKTKDRPTEHSLHVLLFNIFLNHKNRLCYLSSLCVCRITYKSHQPFTMLTWHSKHPEMLMKNRFYFFFLDLDLDFFRLQKQKFISKPIFLRVFGNFLS